MLVSGVFAIMVLLGVGAGMSNYAWREAQIEEANNALRAAISASTQLLARWSGDETDAEAQQIRERTAQFLEGVVPGMNVGGSDVTVTLLDPVTRKIRVSVAGDYAMDNVWGPSDPASAGGGLALAQTVSVDVSRYEVAVAADISASMEQEFAGGGVKKIDALKSSMESVARTIESNRLQAAGTMLVAVVPFGSAVRVADTSLAGKTPGKERYVRLLTGAEAGSAAARATSGHWVDSFHHYGTGASMGSLAQRDLPAAHLTHGVQDWEMDGTESIDVSSQVPALGTWDVNDQDFWNGCVMARWGAYWDALAQPAGWTANDASNWPAKSDAAAWTSGGSALTGAPLHLSDEPPDAGKPSTRFTAYSWPDARISGTSDVRLHTVLAETLVPGTVDIKQFVFRPAVDALADAGAHNDWALAQDSGGNAQCPDYPIVPLTEDATALRAAIAQLDFIPDHGSGSNTLLHLGVVWALRTLSPHWLDIWQTEDAQSPAVKRPLTNCAPGDVPLTEDCDPNLQKSILLISDGQSVFGNAGTTSPSRAGFKYRGSTTENVKFQSYSDVCNQISRAAGTPYDDAMSNQNASSFNGFFSTLGFLLDAMDGFEASGLAPLLDAFHKAVGPPTSGHSREQALIGMTPWELFRGDGFRQDGTSILDTLVDPSNDFGLDGRPVHNDVCRYTSLFTPYGQLDDLVNVGGRPVAGVAPFAMDPSWTPLIHVDFVQQVQRSRLDPWLRDACTYAGMRRVRVNAIFIGPSTDTTAIRKLEDCVDLAGGDPNVDEVFVTPTAADLQAAFDELFVVRRQLRFLN